MSGNYQQRVVFSSRAVARDTITFLAASDPDELRDMAWNLLDDVIDARAQVAALADGTVAEYAKGWRDAGAFLYGAAAGSDGHPDARAALWKAADQATAQATAIERATKDEQP